MDILILQNAKEYGLAKRVFDQRIKQVKIYAWSPLVLDALWQDNIEYSLAATASFQYANDYRIEQLKKFRDFCRALDYRAATTISAVREFNLTPFLDKLHAFRIFFCLYFFEIDKLAAVCSLERPEKIYYFASRDQGQNLLADVIENIAVKEEWPYQFVSLSSEQTNSTRTGSLVPNWFVQCAGWKKLVKALLRSRGMARLLSILESWSGRGFFKKGAPTILVLSENIEIANLFPNLAKEYNYRLVFWEDVAEIGQTKLLIGGIENFRHGIINDTQITDWLMYCGVNLFNLFFVEIEKTIHNDLPLFVATIQELGRLKKIFNFRLVITGYWLTQWQALINECNRQEIPVATFLHGGTIGHLEGFPDIPVSIRNDVATKYFHHFVYSQAIVEFMNQQQQKFAVTKPEIRAFSSVYYRQLFVNNQQEQSDAEEIKICYICGAFGDFNADFKIGFYDDVFLYHLRRRVITMFANQPHFKVYYKMGYETEKLKLRLENEIRSNKWENIMAVGSNRRLTGLFKGVDVFFIEVPSSCLVETSCTYKPIIALFDERILNLTDSAANLLSGRVTMAHSEREVIDYLENLRENGRTSKIFKQKNHQDNRFIKRFALNDLVDGDNQYLKKFLQEILCQK